MRLPHACLASFLVGGLLVRAAAPEAAARLDTATAVHILNRLTFGATAREVARLQTTGLDGWLAAQLHPSRIADEQVQARLAAFPTLTMTPRRIAETYFLPALARRRAAALESTTAMTARPDPSGDEPAARPADGRPPEARPERQVTVELVTQKLLRATRSERQLEEVLVDLWFNHFNVFAGKGPVRQYVGDFERAAIRPHVFGSFREMLGAVASHPAMLFYLDNWQSSAPGTRGMRGATGLNENYARELLELHTLGVDGGYTQQDVVEVARAFTGWTIRQPRAGGEAFFDRRRHDPRAKIVLGQVIPAGGGREDGERVLDLLARHPATARHVARKLATRLVADVPPPALVERVAARFLATDGDLRATVEAVVRSPEFMAAEARLTKIRTPLEFVASAMRVLDTDVRQAGPLGQQLRALGMPPYHAAPPTGYLDRADAWTTAGALVQRMNLAVALAHGRLRGVAPPVLPDLVAGAGEPRAVELALVLLLREPSPETRRVVAQARTTAEMAALILGSPEFQRR